MPENEEASNDKRPRLVSADLVKGVAIIGMVVLHLALLQGHGSEPVTSTSVGIMMFKGIPYSLLCMFIVISGYFYVSGGSYVDRLKKRILKFTIYLIGAIVVLNTLMYLILWLQGGYDLEPSQLWDVIRENIIGRGAFKTFDEINVYGGIILAPFEVTHQLYYLQMMIVGYLIFYAVVDKVIDDVRKLFVTVFILVTISAAYIELVGVVLPFYAHLGPMAAAFLLIGTYLSRLRFYEWLESGQYDKRYWLTLLALLLISVLLCFITPRDPSIIYCNFGPFGGWSLYSFVILSVAGGMMLSFIISWLRYLNIFKKTIGMAGVFCLSVYVLHMFVAKCLATPFVRFNTEVWVPVGTVAGFILSFVTVAMIVIASYYYRMYRTNRRNEKKD